mmetsp:Transcript_3075/g.5026  ORF Transcript_3075/g.5026 Transcript_3075/m.5026 type:complete len:149 (-) Transcript_3075:756-1202(-)
MHGWSKAWHSRSSPPFFLVSIISTHPWLVQAMETWTRPLCERETESGSGQETFHGRWEKEICDEATWEKENGAEQGKASGSCDGQVKPSDKRTCGGKESERRPCHERGEESVREISRTHDEGGTYGGVRIYGGHEESRSGGVRKEIWT